MSQTTNAPASLIADLQSTTAAFADFGMLQARADAQLYKALAVVAKVTEKYKRKEFVAAANGKFAVRDDTPKETIVLKLAYGWETKTKIAQVSAWSKVLKEAKQESIEPDELVEWIERCGGIEAIRNGWYKETATSDAKAEDEAANTMPQSAPSAGEAVAEATADAASGNAATAATSSDTPTVPVQDPSDSMTEDQTAAENERKVLAAVAQFSDDKISEPTGQKQPAPRDRAFQLLDGEYTTTATIPQSYLNVGNNATNDVVIPLLKRNASGDWDVIAMWTGGPVHTNAITSLGDCLNRMSAAENGQLDFFALYAEEKAEQREAVASVVDAIKAESPSVQSDEGRYRFVTIAGDATGVAESAQHHPVSGGQ